MTSILDTIVPKSDQLNADDLISGPRTIKITKVMMLGDKDQPVAVGFEGDNGKPYKPGKSMRRVMVSLWGADTQLYIGRSMTIYRDEKIRFGGEAVGGIRISHMSDIPRETTLALTETRAKRKPFTVKPLNTAPTVTPQNGARTGADAGGERARSVTPPAQDSTPKQGSQSPGVEGAGNPPSPAPTLSPEERRAKAESFAEGRMKAISEAADISTLAEIMGHQNVSRLNAAHEDLHRDLTDAADLRRQELEAT